MMVLDVNVWLAGIWDGHADHAKAVRWRQRAEGPLGMCRVTQMALLRHLTNPAVMGAAAQTRRGAWGLVTRQMNDPDVVWVDEPEDVEDVWHVLSARDDRNHKLWTDDYLAAFAQAAGATFVTLDRAMVGRYRSVAVVVI